VKVDDEVHISAFELDETFWRVVAHIQQSALYAIPKALISLLHQKLWKVNVRESPKKVVHECTLCFRYKPRLMQQVMGNIPAARLHGQRQFLETVCGPFMTSKRLQGKSPYKSYAAVQFNPSHRGQMKRMMEKH